MGVGSTVGLQGIGGKDKILKELISRYSFNTVFDVGCGQGELFYHLKNLNKSYDVSNSIGLDMMDESDVLFKEFNYVKSNVFDYYNDQKYDLIHTAHVIEHVTNTEDFLKKFFSFGKNDGVFCIIWPPPKGEIVGGHVHIFNLGLMLYNIIRIGIDCSKVNMFKYGYNLIIMGKIKRFQLPKLTYNRHEIEILKNYFPFEAYLGFDGNNPPGTINIK